MAGLRVVIIGGGIGGLAAAIALLSKGAQVQVYEMSRSNRRSWFYIPSVLLSM